MNRIFLILIICVSPYILWSQGSPFNLQGIAIDPSGKPIRNTNIDLKFSVLDGTATGSSVYVETQTVSTNDNGIFNASVGAGTTVTGNFNSIDWSSIKFLRTEMLSGASYVELATSKIQAVPFSNYALKTNETQDLQLIGGELKITNNANATPIDLSPYLGTNTDNQNLGLGVRAGTQQPINISGGTGVTIDVADNDNNSTNEIQDLALAGNTLSLTNAATTINLSPYLDNTDNQSLTLGAKTGTQQPINISGGTGVTIDVADNDNNATNEIQDLSLTANTLSLSGDATAINLTPYLDNTDNQDLALVGNTLSLTNDATTINLVPYLDNTDSQNLTLGTRTGTQQPITISGGTGVTIDVADNDNNATNEIQDLSLTANTLSLSSDATTVNLAPYLDNTDNQDLALAGNTLSLTNDATTINLAPYLDNTDTQTLSFTSPNLSISGGNSINLSTINTDNQDLSIAGNILSLTNDATTVSLAPYLDNTDNQDLALVGNTLSLTNDATTINLVPYLDNTDSQNLTLGTRTGTQQPITISGGTGVTIDVADNDNNATNEIQDLSLTANTLSLSSDATTVNLAPYLDNTDNQDLALAGNTLSLTNDATTINLAPYLDNTDTQTLSFTSPNLSISGGNSINLSTINTDNQDLALAGNTLSLTNDATPINLAPYLDNTDNQDLALAGNILSLSNDASTINLAPYLDNTDTQTLSFTTPNLSISGGNSINLSAVNTDNQDLSLAGNILSLTGDGTTVDLSGYSQNLDNVLTRGNDAGNKKIANLANPTSLQDAATKSYVDAAVVGWTKSGNSITDPTLEFIGTTNAQPFAFRTNNTERMRISATGNLGLGTASPAHKLHVQATTSQVLVGLPSFFTTNFPLGLFSGAVYEVTGGSDNFEAHSGLTSITSSTGSSDFAITGISKGTNPEENSGVFGYATGSTSSGNRGVFGFAEGQNNNANTGVYGSAKGTNNPSIGIYGISNSDGQKASWGIFGESKSAGNSGQPSVGVYGTASGHSNSNIGVQGTVNYQSTYSYGIYGASTGTGDGGSSTENVAVVGWASGNMRVNTGLEGHASDGLASFGVNAIANGTNINYGISATASGGTTNYGIYSTASGGTNNYAGYFEGEVNVTTKVNIGVMMNLKPQSTPPSNPQRGDVYYDGTTDTLKYWNGTIWKSI